MAKKAPNLLLFTRDLQKLMQKHGCYLLGNHRISTDEIINSTTLACEVTAEIAVQSGIHTITDRSGPFIIVNADRKEIIPSFYQGNKSHVSIMDKDRLLANGVVSPIDQTVFHNRRDWANHLKSHDCVEFGNDLNNAKAPTEMRGDFNCREELGKATYQIMEKYGH
jgi:hypothetical protein